MGWFENTPASARLALSIGGVAVAALVQYLPESLQRGALALGIALCCYGVAASMSTLLKSSDDGLGSRTSGERISTASRQNSPANSVR